MLDQNTEQPHVKISSPWPIITPLVSENWRFLLAKHGILDEFMDVIIGIEEGFTLNSMLSIFESCVYRNHASALQNRHAVNKTIQKEVTAGRYYGPYSKANLESLLGRPFVSHPIGVVPKANGVDFRVVEDLSWPRNSSVKSVNALTDFSDVPVDWGGMAEMMDFVITAKEGAQGATLDWGEAFRQIPIRRDELWMGIVQWNVDGDGPDEFYVDGCTKFGHSRSNGNFGMVNKAFVTLVAREGLGNIIYWVDDLCSRREPTNDHPPWTYNIKTDDIVDVANFLGIPLPKSKIRDYDFKTRYLGFDWHWDRKEVEVPPEKKAKARVKIASLTNNRSISFKDLSSLCGYLAHLSLVIYEGKARIRALYRMLTRMEERGTSCFVWWPSALKELVWWDSELQKPTLSMRLCTERVPDDNLGVYADASTSWGIGIVINGEYDQFQLTRGWETSGEEGRRDIGWAEFVAIELAVYFLISTYQIHQKHILIHSDNQGVVKAWKARASRSPEQNAVLLRIIHMLSKCQSFISLEYIPSECNPADAASRGGTPHGLQRRHFRSFPKSLIGLLSHN